MLFGRFTRHFSSLKSEDLLILIVYKPLMSGFPFTYKQMYSSTPNILFYTLSSFVFHTQSKGWESLDGTDESDSLNLQMKKIDTKED